jgi:hypothetical protein
MPKENPFPSDIYQVYLEKGIFTEEEVPYEDVFLPMLYSEKERKSIYEDMFDLGVFEGDRNDPKSYENFEELLTELNLKSHNQSIIKKNTPPGDLESISRFIYGLFDNPFNVGWNLWESLVTDKSLEESFAFDPFTKERLISSVASVESAPGEVPFYYNSMLLEEAKNQIISSPYVPNKKEREAKNNILKVIDEQHHKNFAGMYNHREKIRQEYIDTGLIDPNAQDFIMEHSKSAGMQVITLPLFLAGGKIGGTLGTALKTLGILGAVSFEASEIMGNAYAGGAEKDEKGYIIPGTGNIEDGLAAGIPATLSGLAELFGVEQILMKVGKKFSKGMLKNTFKKQAFKTTALSGTIEMGEEGIQSTIGQLTQMGLGYQDEYDWMELINSGKHGLYSGLTLGGAVGVYSGRKAEEVYKDVKEKVKKTKENLKKNPYATKKEIEKIDIVDKALDKTTPENLVEVIKEYDETIKDVRETILERMLKEVETKSAYQKILTDEVEKQGIDDQVRRVGLYKRNINDETSDLKKVKDPLEIKRITLTIDRVIDRGISEGKSADEIVGEITARGFSIGNGITKERNKTTDYVRSRVENNAKKIANIFEGIGEEENKSKEKDLKWKAYIRYQNEVNRVGEKHKQALNISSNIANAIGEGIPVKDILARNFTESQSEQILSMVESLPEFSDIQQQMEGSTPQEKLQNTHQFLFESNPNIYMSLAYDMAFRNTEVPSEEVTSGIEIEEAITEDLYKELIEEVSKSQESVGINVPSNFTIEERIDKNGKPYYYDTVNKKRTSKEAYENQQNTQTLFEEFDYEINRNYGYPGWFEDYHRAIANRFRNRTPNGKRTAPRYPFKPIGMKMNDIYRLIREINEEYGAEVVKWSSPLQAIVFTKNRPNRFVDFPEEPTLFEESNERVEPELSRPRFGINFEYVGNENANVYELRLSKDIAYQLIPPRKGSQYKPGTFGIGLSTFTGNVRYPFHNAYIRLNTEEGAKSNAEIMLGLFNKGTTYGTQPINSLGNLTDDQILKQKIVLITIELYKAIGLNEVELNISGISPTQQWLETNVEGYNEFTVMEKLEETLNAYEKSISETLGIPLKAVKESKIFQFQLNDKDDLYAGRDVLKKKPDLWEKFSERIGELFREGTTQNLYGFRIFLDLAQYESLIYTETTAKPSEILFEESTELPFETPIGNIKGDNISSDSKGLAAALTNSTVLARKKGNIKGFYNINYNGKNYVDVESAYQSNKEEHLKNGTVLEFMTDLIEIKLRTYPQLVEGINKKGGIAYLQASTHNVKNDGSYWESSGENGFIRALTEAYRRVSGISQLRNTETIEYPVKIWLDKNTFVLTTELIQFRDEYLRAPYKSTNASWKDYDDSEERIAVIKKYDKLFDLLYREIKTKEGNQLYIVEELGLGGDETVDVVINTILEKNRIIRDPNQMDLFGNSNTQLDTKDIQSTQVIGTSNFQGYKGGFEDKGKGTPEGDGKDKAMREVADGFIGELNYGNKEKYLQGGLPKKKTSSSTSYLSIFNKVNYDNTPTESENEISSRNTNDGQGTVAIYSEASTIMLARNSSLKGKPLKENTKEAIKEASLSGKVFVVGDMPGVDSQFIDYLQEIGAKFTIYHTGNKPRIQVKAKTQLEALQDTQSTQAIEIPTQGGKVSQNVSNAKIKAFTLQSLTARLKSNPGFKDVSTEEFIEWAIDYAKDAKVVIADSSFVFPDGQQFGNNRGAFSNGTIYLNNDYLTTAKLEDIYNTFGHETVHFITAEALDPNSSKFNRQFRNEMEGLYNVLIEQLNTDAHKDFRLENANDLKRIFIDSSLTGEAKKNALTKALQELLAHTFGRTSAIYDWTRNNAIDVKGKKSSFFSQILEKIKTLFRNLLQGKPITYYFAMESLLSKYFGYDRVGNYMDALSESTRELEVSDSEELHDYFDAINKRELTGVDVRNIVRMINPNVVDPYRYIQNLTYSQLASKLFTNETFLKTSKTYYDENNFKIGLNLYRKRLARKIYNHANSLVKRKVIRLVTEWEKTNKTASDPLGKKLLDSKIYELGDTYYDKDFVQRSSYREKIMLDDKVNLLSQLIGKELEIVYLDDVKEIEKRLDYKTNKLKYSGTKWKSIASLDYDFLEGRNQLYASILKEKGILFPGTWSDKKTVIGIRAKDGSQINLDKIGNFYIRKMDEFLQYAQENGLKDFDAKTIELYKKPDSAFSKLKSNYTLRLLLEDLRLGATIDDQGNINNVIFNPEYLEKYGDTVYNALKIFKRPTDVSPLRQITIDSKLHKEIYDSLSSDERIGIELNEEGILQFNAVVVNLDATENPIIPMEYKGKKLNEDEGGISLKEILINELGTDNFDGANVYLNGWGKVIRELSGAIKDGVLKGKVLNKYGNPPFYDKGAYFYSQSSILKNWVKENNIGLIIFKSAAKVNSYPETQLLGQANIIKFPFSDYYHDTEKSSADDEAKGLVQSLTTNFTAKANPNFVQYDDRVWKRQIEVLANTFIEQMYKLNPDEVLRTIKSMALESRNRHQSTVASIMVDYLYKITGDKVRVALKEEQIANDIGNLFLEPSIATVLKHHIRRNLNKVIKHKLDSSWLTLRPDFGWLEPNFIDEVWNNIRKEIDEEEIIQKERLDRLNRSIDVLDAEYSELEDAIDKVPEDSKGELEELTKQKEELEKEIESVVKARDTIVKDLEKNKEEETWNRLSQIIDLRTGKLKDGWTLLSKDANDVFNIKFRDDVIITAVPGSDISSQSAPKVAALINTGDEGTVTMNSEYIQSVVGKDFDIDQLLLTPFNRKFFDKTGFKEYVDSINESREKYLDYVYDEYKRVLGKERLDRAINESGVNLERLSEKKKKRVAILDSEVQKEYMQVMTNSDQTGQEIFNPLTQSLSILDKFTKQIGQVLNDNKIFTAQAQMGFKSKVKLGNKTFQIDPGRGSARFSVFTSRLLHDAVDKPTNTNGFFYEVKDWDKYNIAYDMGLSSDINIQTLTDLSKALNNINRVLFKYATKLTSGYNLNDRDSERGLAEDLTYIQNQQMINKWLMEGNKDALYGLVLRNSFDLSSQERKLIKEIIDNIEIDNLSDAFSFYMIENIPIHVIPNLEITLQEYSKWQDNIIKRLLEDREYKDVVETAKRNNQQYIKRFLSERKVNGVELNPKDNEELFYQFLATRYDGKENDLHLLKTKLITLITPYDQEAFAVHKGNVKFWQNSLDLGNDYSFPKLFSDLLTKRAIHFRNNVIAERGIKLKTPNNNVIELKKNSRQNLEISFHTPDGKIYTYEANDLLHDNLGMSKRFLSYLIGENSVFTSSNFDFKKKVYDPYETNRNVVLSEPAAWNRKQLSDLVSFRNNTDLRQRIEFALELLNKELPKYNELEKKVFWNSLVGYPKGNIFYPLNLIPPTVKLFGETTFSTQRELLELASKVDDPSGREFLKRYIPIASQEFPGISFNKSMRIREQLEDNGAVRNEVIFDSPEYEKYSRSPEYVNNTLFEEEQGNLIKELTPVTKKFITISGISFKNKSEDFDGNEFLGLAYDILNGKAVPITRKAITDMVFSLLTNIEKSKISLEEVAMYKTSLFTKTFRGFEERFTRLKENVIRNINAVTENLGEKEITKVISEINLLSEKLPYKITDITSRSIGKYEYTVNGNKYDDVERLLDAVGISDVNERLKHKAAIDIRTIYDYLNIKLAKNMLTYINQRILLAPEEGFANLSMLFRLRNLWQTRLNKFEGMKGRYIPHTFTQEVFEQLNREHAAFRYVKHQAEQNNEEVSLAELRKRANELENEIDFERKIERYKIREDVNGGRVYSWDMKRQLEDWIVKERYVTDTLDIHQRHMLQFFSAARQDFGTIESLFYEHNASLKGKPQLIKNQMKLWYGMHSPSQYLKSTKVEFRDLKIGDAIAFYKRKPNGAEQYIKGVFEKQDNEYIYLSFDEDIERRNREIEFNRYSEVHNHITSNDSFYKELEKLGIEYEPSISIAQASELLFNYYRDRVNNVSNAGRYKKSEIYVKQYADDRVIYPNGVERAWKSMELPKSIAGKKIGTYEIPKNMEELLQQMQKVSSVLFLGTVFNTGSAVRNTEEAMWRTIQSVGFRRFLLPYGLRNNKYSEKLPQFLLKGEKRMLRDAIKFYKEFSLRVESGDLDIYDEASSIAYSVENIESLNLALKDTNPDTVTKMKVLEGLVAKYLFEHGLAEISEIGSSYVPGKPSEQERGKKEKVILGFNTALFKKAERLNRVLGAYLHAYEAMMIEGITDVNMINNAIEKGVARANSSYEMFERQLIESSAGGRMGGMFSQFQVNQLDQFRMMIEQGKELGQIKDVKEELKNFNFHQGIMNALYNINNVFKSNLEIKDEKSGEIKTYKSGDIIDPNIPRKIFKEFLTDTTIGTALEFMFPGLRIGNPINKILNLPLVYLAQVLINGGDEWDEWDWSEWLFTLLGFKIGMWFAAPIQLLWNIAFERENPVPINPRVYSVPLKTADYLLFSDAVTPRQKVNQGNYIMGVASKALTSIDLTPHTRQHYSDLRNEITSEFGLFRPFTAPFKILEEIGVME